MVLGMLKGEPPVTKLAAVAKYVVLPGAMIACLIHSPPDYYRRWRARPANSGSSSSS